MSKAVKDVLAGLSDRVLAKHHPVRCIVDVFLDGAVVLVLMVGSLYEVLCNLPNNVLLLSYGSKEISESSYHSTGSI